MRSKWNYIFFAIFLFVLLNFFISDDTLYLCGIVIFLLIVLLLFGNPDPNSDVGVAANTLGEIPLGNVLDTKLFDYENATYTYSSQSQKSTSKNLKTPKPKSHTKKFRCRVCKTSMDKKSVGERIVKGTSGGVGGTVMGTIVGTLVAPGIGTLIGAGLGGVVGTADGGSQIDDICNNCCPMCSRRNSKCDCHDVIGRCLGCSTKVTNSNSSRGYCYSCLYPLGDEY